MKVLVTGGTGLLGNTVVRQLSHQGDSSLCVVRRDPAPAIFADTSAEIVRGDLCDVDSIDRMVRRCDAVIHCAGLIHLGWTRLQESLVVNRDAVRVLAEAAIRHDKKLVHVGSVNTLAVGSETAPSRESTPIDNENDQVPCSYVTSKRAGVLEVHRGVKRGLRATIVHPGFMLGPWDWKPSSSRMILELMQMPVFHYPVGGCSVCDSRDVAAGVVNAINNGGDDGREYILGGENWTYQKLWREIAIRVDRPIPSIPIGPVAQFLGSIAGDLKAKLTGSEGDVNSAAIRMSRRFHFYDSSRAIAELGYEQRPAVDSLDTATEWIRRIHMDERPATRIRLDTTPASRHSGQKGPAGAGKLSIE